MNVQNTRDHLVYLINRIWDCPEEGSSNPRLGSIMSIVVPGRVDCENNTIPEPPVTAGSTKLPGWPIRELVSP